LSIRRSIAASRRTSWHLRQRNQHQRKGGQRENDDRS
jgi:hypothetical protein